MVLVEIFNPIDQLLLCRICFSDALPRKEAFHFRMLNVASFSPKIKQGTKIFWPLMISLRIFRNTKADVFIFFMMSNMGLSCIKKVMSNATASIGFEKG